MKKILSIFTFLVFTFVIYNIFFIGEEDIAIQEVPKFTDSEYRIMNFAAPALYPTNNNVVKESVLITYSVEVDKNDIHDCF